MRPLLVLVAMFAFVRGQTFKSTVEHVAVPVTIHSDPNEPVPEFHLDDFRVFDDGRPVKIVSFGKVRQSVHVLLLLDTSRSMMNSLSEVRSAAAAVITRLAPNDTIQVGTFSSLLRLSPPFSADDTDLATRLTPVPGANMTILYDALVEGTRVFKSEMERRAIFVVSDGTDTASVSSARMVMQRAAESNVAIYAVGVAARSVLRGKSIVRAPDSSFREIAEDTGGRYVYAGTGGDFSKVLGGMMEELHRQYLLGFVPAVADGRLHSLVVRVGRPNVRIQARKHYLAPSP